MEQRAQVVSRFYRLKMSEELRRMLESMPLRVEEVMDKSYVYLGRGVLELSGKKHRAEVTVRVQGRRMTANVSVPSAGVAVEGPFETPEEMAAFPETVRKAVVAAMD